MKTLPCDIQAWIVAVHHTITHSSKGAKSSTTELVGFVNYSESYPDFVSGQRITIIVSPSNEHGFVRFIPLDRVQHHPEFDFTDALVKIIDPCDTVVAAETLSRIESALANGSGVLITATFDVPVEDFTTKDLEYRIHGKLEEIGDLQSGKQYQLSKISYYPSVYVAARDAQSELLISLPPHMRSRERDLVTRLSFDQRSGVKICAHAGEYWISDIGEKSFIRIFGTVSSDGLIPAGTQASITIIPAPKEDGHGQGLREYRIGEPRGELVYCPDEELSNASLEITAFLRLEDKSWITSIIDNIAHQQVKINCTLEKPSWGDQAASGETVDAPIIDFSINVVSSKQKQR